MFLVTFSFTCSCAVVRVGGAVASWLVRAAPNRAVLVRSLAGDIALCSRLRLSQCVSTQVYKWVPIKLNAGITLRWASIPSREGGGGGGKNTPSLRNWNKLCPGGPLGSYADWSSLICSVFAVRTKGFKNTLHLFWFITSESEFERIQCFIVHF